jgi:hypothetical protein
MVFFYGIDVSQGGLNLSLVVEGTLPLTNHACECVGLGESPQFSHRSHTVLDLWTLFRHRLHAPFSALVAATVTQV